MEKFATNASGAGGLTNASGVMLLLNLIQVTESISGSVVPLAMFGWDFAIFNTFWAGPVK